MFANKFRIVPYTCADGVKYIIQRRWLPFLWINENCCVQDVNDILVDHTPECLLAKNSVEDCVAELERRYGENFEIVHYKF